MRPVRLLTSIIFCAMTTIFTVKAQTVCRDAADSIPCARVSLLTCAPGQQIYELEGHSGLRLQWDNYDMVANWGLFDFESPNFIYRFVKGETDYCVGMYDTEIFLNQYSREGRRVTEQELNLTGRQAEDVIRSVLENIRPENRVYRYNYVKDNCATRPLAIIENAIGDSITLGYSPDATSISGTFRGVMRHYHWNYPWYQFGIDLALGNGLDRTITNREVAFAPHALQEMLSDATVTDSTGRKVPIVKGTEILVPGNPQGTGKEPTPWYLTPTAAMWAMLALTLTVTWRDIRRKRVNRLFDAILYTAYGAIGCVIAFLVFVSVHEASSPNYLLLWLNPLLLTIPVMIYIKSCRRAVAAIQTANLTAMAIYAVAAMAGIQWVNPAFIPMILCDAIRAADYIYQTKRHANKDKT